MGRPRPSNRLRPARCRPSPLITGRILLWIHLVRTHDFGAARILRLGLSGFVYIALELHAYFFVPSF